MLQTPEQEYYQICKKAFYLLHNTASLERDLLKEKSNDLEKAYEKSWVLVSDNGLRRKELEKILPKETQSKIFLQLNRDLDYVKARDGFVKIMQEIDEMIGIEGKKTPLQKCMNDAKTSKFPRREGLIIGHTNITYRSFRYVMEPRTSSSTGFSR